MNAPWNPGRSGPRDAFAGFVCDDHSQDVMRTICSEMGWPVEKAAKGGLRHAIQTLSVSSSPSILFVDLSETADCLGEINALAEVCEPGTVVIATGQINDVRLYRDLLASGIQEYILKPFTPDQVRDAIAAAQTVLSAPRATDDGDVAHNAFAVLGARGGVGASTIASSLAWTLGAKLGRRTALLDLDIHFGTAALALDLEPGRGLSDAIENPSRIDGLFIERAMVRASDTLSVLSAEAPMSQPLLTDGAAFFQLQEELKAAFETTVIDLPRQMVVAHPHLVADLQGLVVVSELTLACARDVIRICAWAKGQAPNLPVLVVANQVSGADELTRKDFEASIERKVDLLIAADSKCAIESAKTGKPFAECAKAGKGGDLFAQLARMLVASEDDAIVAKGGAFKDRLATFTAMLPGRKKATA